MVSSCWSSPIDDAFNAVQQLWNPGPGTRFADVALGELIRWSDRCQHDDDVTFVVTERRAKLTGR